uniref:Uncharacterized protein n=1 Tax=Bionectria ochroleuca TaxID=29856 RepID=A0A8H7N860_BIOOC
MRSLDAQCGCSISLIVAAFRTSRYYYATGLMDGHGGLEIPRYLTTAVSDRHSTADSPCRQMTSSRPCCQFLPATTHGTSNMTGHDGLHKFHAIYAAWLERSTPAVLLKKAPYIHK